MPLLVINRSRLKCLLSGWARKLVGEREVVAVKAASKTSTAKPAAKPSVTSGVRAAHQENASAQFEHRVPKRIEQEYKSFESLPNFNAVLSATDGAVALTPEGQREMIALLLNDKSVLLCFVNSQVRKSIMASGYKKRLTDANYVISLSGIIASDVMADIYAERNGLASAGVVKGVVKEDVSSVASRLFDSILNDGVINDASDIHICLRESSAVVLLRIHGEINQHRKYPRNDILEAIGVAFNKMADPATRSDTQFNMRVSQNCVIDRNLAGKSYRFRFQLLPVLGGVDAVIRILKIDSSREIRSLEELGYLPGQIHELTLAARRSVGLIAIAGVTGSGKTTTLNTLMTMGTERASTKQYSLEDPVEYRMFGVSQISFQRDEASADDSKLMVAAAKATMRGDPDTMMIGEIRDYDMGSLLVAIVQTGHRALTTVHAASAIEIVSRLTGDQIRLPRQALTGRNFISALCYQRLVPRLCERCKQPAKTAYGDEYVDSIGMKFNIPTDKMFARNKNGCYACKGGIEGRTVVAEILTPSLDMLQLIRDGKDADAEMAWRQTRKSEFGEPDMTGKTAFEHALYRCATGWVDPKDIENEFEPFERYMVVPRTYMPGDVG